MKPTICAVLIGRNEERDIPRCLLSLSGIADEIVYVDTGSTDESMKIARHHGANVSSYLDASEPNPDKPGEYRIVNFAKARNRALELGEATGASHLFWLDCDDEVLTPLAIRRAAYLPAAAYGVWIELGNRVRQVHARIWPAAWKIRFHGWVHEYAVLDGHQQIVLNDTSIRHDATPHASAGEDSNQRNLRILTAEYAHEPSGRTAFYLANTHKDGKRWEQAIEWYLRRLAHGEGYPDEANFARLYHARCLRAAGRKKEAIGVCREALIRASDWQEFRMEIAFIHYEEGRYREAIAEAVQAIGKPIPQTQLWREPQMYRDQGARLISWSYEHLGDLAESLNWSREATKLIGNPDADWAKREESLEQRQYQAPPAIVKGLRPMIALNRPGAIGDILMTLNLLPAFKEANPDADVHYFCHANYAKADALGSIITAAGADLVIDCAQLNSMRGRYERVISLVGYPLAENYPNVPMRQHLLKYFAEELGLPIQDGLPALTLPRPKRPIDQPYITIQPQAGWSAWNEWSLSRWDEVIKALRYKLKVPEFIQLGAENALPLRYANRKYLATSLSTSIALVANADLHVGVDSWANHATNFYWQDERGNGRRTLAVILFGSTQPSASGYPSNLNICHQPPCGPCFREDSRISSMPRGVCVTPATKPDGSPREYGDGFHACMDNIRTHEVIEAIEEKWKKAHAGQSARGLSNAAFLSRGADV
jgi:ADP-heptose:LPS heptosyltransferase/glycosyltransferase involved in cell wall biosynthesis